MYSKNVINEVANSYSDFDLEGALNDLVKWQMELDPKDYEDSVTFSTLEGVIDIIIDYCSF